MNATIPTPPPARMLERALLLTFVIHVAAMLGMVACLLPGLPGGSSAGAAERMGYVAAHPWVWRLGWFGWQLTAASDLFLSIALLCTPWISRRLSIPTLAVTLIALVPDQVGQFIWAWIVPAQLADSGVHDLIWYQDLEGKLFQAVGGWAAALYLVGAIGWTLCLYRAGVWSRALKWLSILAWSVFGIGVMLLCLPRSMWTPSTLAAAGGLNAFAFVLLLGWIAEAAEQVMRRARPDQPHGRHAVWKYPRPGVYGKIVEYLANSRFIRGLFEYVPPLAMASEIRDVIYVNYLVDAEMLAPLVPPPLRLQRLGDGQKLAMFTFLIYRHGHFGPRIFGPLRRWWASPLQSNWRLYVTDPAGRDGVLFVTTTISMTPYALAARLLSEGVPMHVPREMKLQQSPAGEWLAEIDPGHGSAPDLRLSLLPAAAPDSTSWTQAFASWDSMLAYCVPQDRALNVQPWYGRLTRQEIDLGIPLASCRPLVGVVDSAAARAIAGDAEPFCFYVPAVDFFFRREQYDAI